MGKLLFFDADETTFSNKTKCVPQSTRKAFQLAQENGHKIFLNTGRPFGFQDNELASVDFDGYLCSNGNYISYHDEILHHELLPEDICKEILELIPKYHIKAYIGSHDCSYFYDEDDHFHPYQDVMIRLYKSCPEMPVEFGYDNVTRFEKMVAFAKNAEDMNRFLEALKKLPFSFDFVKNGPAFYEINPSRSTKGTAIEFIADHLNHSLDDCYAFGDAPNDVPMFDVAGHSILLGNGYDELKTSVEYVTTDIDEDGIYNGMKHFHLI